MKAISLLFAAALVAAAAAAPTVAAPLHIQIYGATPLAPNYYDDGGDNGVTSFYDNPYVFGDPFSPGFDPAGQDFFPHYNTPKTVDLVQARTLDLNHESILQHIERCQAAYPSYNAATDMYDGPNRLPIQCLR